MSFTYSRALVAAFSAGNSLDTEPFAPLKSNHTLAPFLWHDKMMELSPRSQFGMMCEPLTEDRGADLLTWWLAGFPVKTSAQLVKEWGLAVSAADCGASSLASLARYDPATHSLKTAQCSLLEDLTECSPTLPRWGLMRSGAVYQQPIVALGMRETGFGFSQETWATPVCMDCLPPKSEEALMREATIARPGRSKPANLRDQVSNMHMWPTPCSTDSKGAGKTGQLRDRLDYAVERGATKSQTYESPQQAGQLNPMWEDWLMGWPIGHTGLEPLETDKFQEWKQSHSLCLERG